MLTPPPLRTLPTVLLVEDNTQIQQLVASVLRREGYRVLLASDGNEASDSFQHFSEDLDLLLLDLDLPGRHGLAVLRDVRKERPKLPVLIATGSLGFTLGELNDPSTALLRKPYTMDELRRVVRGLLELSPRRS